MLPRQQVHKISIVGNAGGGKTTLARRLAITQNLPVIHVDSIQFQKDLRIRSYKESIDILNSVQERESWIIDGYGPLDIIEKRFQMADRIVMIDLPLWRHFWWGTKRQIKNLWSRREELPEGCDERSWSHTWKLYKTLWRVHRQMRPELLRILNRESLREKVILVRTLSAWKQLYKNGITNLENV